MRLKNKKAASGDIYLSPWMFLIWILVAVAVAIGVIMFLSSLGDIRNFEASVLSTRILDCLSTDFSYAEVSAKDFDIYTKCNLDRNTFDDTLLFYFNINIDNNIIIKGGHDFYTECQYQLNKGVTEKNMPQCNKKSLVVLDKSENANFKISVVAASNQRRE